MYIQEISLKIKSGIDYEALLETFDLVMSSYRGSGQTQGKVESQFVTDNTIFCYPYTLEEDALNAKYNNHYVNYWGKKTEEIAKAKLQFKTVGKSHKDYNGQCKCVQSEFYILQTNYVSYASPITCGTCNLSIPLYKLPIYYDYGYKPILSWESNYQSCDILNMNCAVGEVWAMKQMWRAGSQLSKQGIEICKKITELTKIPTFYYLFNYRSIRHSNDIKRKCPCCGGEWLLQEKLHNIFDFKCDNCNLISSLSDNSY